MKTSTTKLPLIGETTATSTSSATEAIKFHKSQYQELSPQPSKCYIKLTRMAKRLRDAPNISIRFGRASASSMAGLVLIMLLLSLNTCYSAPSNTEEPGEANSLKQKEAAQVAQRRLGGLEPSDYIDEAGELDIMANQQTIPTAHLMAAAGHIVPENFFLPGGSIPALYARYQHQHSHHHGQQQQQQQQQQQHQQVDQIQQLASHNQARFLAPHKYIAAARQQADLMAAASGVEQQEVSPLIDYNGYNLIAQASEAREAGTAQTAAIPQPELIEYLSSASQQSALYEHQQQQLQYLEQQLAAELALANQQQQQQQQQQQSLDNSAQSSENSPDQYAVGPAYQISGHGNQDMMYAGSYEQSKESGGRPFGLPAKSPNKEPTGMLKPLGNPKTISSPVIDFVTNQLPKTTTVEKVNDKLPQTQTPTVFSFSSSKDPMEKVKGVNQKKRTVMRQAEQLARSMIKSFNDKFGTTIGDQTDIPFLLSSIGPLGLAQNILADPTLIVSLLNTAEKTYLSDILPGTAKLAMRPVLNIFRVPNKKRDKANLSNIISFLASGGQVPSSSPKHRQGTGVEKSSKNKSR